MIDYNIEMRQKQVKEAENEDILEKISKYEFAKVTSGLGIIGLEFTLANEDIKIPTKIYKIS